MFEQQRRRLSGAKLRIFSAISFAVLFFLIILTDTFVSNISLHSAAKTKSHIHRMIIQNHSLVQPLNSIKEPIGDEVQETCFHDHNPLVPPLNLTRQQRIGWFKSKLPEFEILKSTNMTRQFQKRVEEFFGCGCSVRFFMTWISPARCFGEREFLAVDSLFKENPDGCLMILSNTMDSVRGFRILKPLLDQGFRVGAISPDLNFLFKNTPAEPWFNHIKMGEKDPGEIPLAQNLSNLIRLVILYKYGGVYVDADFITLKNFKGLRNSIGAQSTNAFGKWTRLNNAVLVFDKNHPLLYKFIEEFASTFNGNKWGYNGPYLVSRVVEREAATVVKSNFTVLPPMAFYPADWTRIGGFFRKPMNRVQRKWVKAKLGQLRGSTYGVHLWNRETSRLRIEEGSIIGKLISDHCVICIMCIVPEQLYTLPRFKIL